MRLGFYYHIPLCNKNGSFFLPGYLAVFVNALAREVEELVLFFHEATPDEKKEADTLLTEPNIVWENLGKKTPAWHRSLFFQAILKPVAKRIRDLDIILVRGPSPLAPYFKSIRACAPKIAYLVVGDYKEGVAGMEIRTFRDRMVKSYTLWNDRKLNLALQNALVVVNSRVLYSKFLDLNISPSLYEVKTTTLSAGDFYERTDSLDEPNAPVNILFTGRIVKEKGLGNIVAACNQLLEDGYPIQLHIAGMVTKGKENYIDQLKKLAVKDSQSFLTYHGLKKVGADLNKLYQDAQIYVLASTSNFEGFPRTIWEAMANSCPVIATRVGSIPHYLEHEHNALLIAPGSVDAIVGAIKRMIEDGDLRRKLIRNGFELAQTNTLDRQTKHLIKILEDHFRP